MEETANSRFPNWWRRLTDFDANPVWIKDLRQAARSRIVPGLLVILTLGFYAVTAIVLFVGEKDDFEEVQPGQPMFESVSLLLMCVSFLFLPIYCFCRTVAERLDSETDLFYITSMSPRQIMNGKWLSVLHLGMLFYSSAIPFLFMSYLMRGVDFPSILLVVLFLFSLNVLLALAAIVLGLQRWDLVPKITIAALLGTTVLVRSITWVFDLIQSAALSSMLEDPWANHLILKAGAYAGIWFLIYTVLMQHGSQLVRNIASMGPQPLLRFSMKPRPQKKRSRQRTAATSPASLDVASGLSPIRQLGLKLIETLQHSKAQSHLPSGNVNAVWHKEYTQTTRNPYVVGILLLLLLIFYTTTCFIVYYNPNKYLGVVVFHTISTIIKLTSCLLIPMYFFARVIGEETSRQRELVLITQLSAGEIVRGKFLSAFHLLLLFFLVVSPFIVASNLFHGIDLHTILLELESSFITSILLTAAAITLGWSPLSISLKTIVCAFAALALIFAPRFLNISPEIPLPAAPDGMEHWPTWMLLTAYFCSAALLVGFFYHWAKAFFLPSAFNRALPFRNYTSLMILLFNALIVVFAWMGDDFQFLKYAIYLNALVVKTGILITLCGKDRSLGTRIRAELPIQLWKRILLFPFSKGRFQGMLWLLGLWCTASGCLIAFAYLWKGYSQPFEAIRFQLMGMTVLVLYCFGFGLLSRAIQHYIVKGSANSTGASLYLAFLTLPSILMEASRQQGWLSGNETIPGVILSLRVAILTHDHPSLTPHLYYALILSLTGLTVNFKWIQWHCRRFTPLAPKLS